MNKGIIDRIRQVVKNSNLKRGDVLTQGKVYNLLKQADKQGVFNLSAIQNNESKASEQDTIMNSIRGLFQTEKKKGNLKEQGIDKSLAISPYDNRVKNQYVLNVDANML